MPALNVSFWGPIADAHAALFGNPSIQASASEDTDLPQEADLIVKQVLLHDLAVLPARDGAELHLERPAGRLMHFAVQACPRADHLALPLCDRAGPVARAEHHAVRVVVEVILDRLEERLRLRLMCIAAAR